MAYPTPENVTQVSLEFKISLKEPLESSIQTLVFLFEDVSGCVEKS